MAISSFGGRSSDDVCMVVGADTRVRCLCNWVSLDPGGRPNFFQASWVAKDGSEVTIHDGTFVANTCKRVTFDASTNEYESSWTM